MNALLSVEDLTMRFGGLVAVDRLTFSVEAGEIRGLIGPNGAGKTTTFNVISGFYRPWAGRVVYQGEDIAGLKMNAVASKGLVRTFQHSTLFQQFTLLENVLIGCHLHHPPNPLRAVFGGDAAARAANLDRALEMLAFFNLAERCDELAAELPHGLQRALGMAVALASEPALLMLDEPFTGMNPEETRRMMELVRRIRDTGVTLLLVEHDMQAVMGLCDRITVLNFGKLLIEGTPEKIQSHPAVIEAYLGAPHRVA
ncbi:MAG: ABC transporter ATP-binding protein [Kiloniellales bacterium]